MLEVFAK